MSELIMEDLTQKFYKDSDCISHFGCGWCANHFEREANCPRENSKWMMALPIFSSEISKTHYICKDYKPIYDCDIYDWNLPNAFEIYQNTWVWSGPDKIFPSKVNYELRGSDHSRSVKYAVKYDDFVNGTLFDEHGELKAISKSYYKVSRKSPTGYEYVTEMLENSED